MSDERVEAGELRRLRQLLVHDEPLPLGVVARLDAGVRRDRAARARVGWEPRIGVACLCFIVVGLSSPSAMNFPLVVVLTLLSALYPWAAVGRERAAPRAAEGAFDHTTD